MAEDFKEFNKLVSKLKTDVEKKMGKKILLIAANQLLVKIKARVLEGNGVAGNGQEPVKFKDLKDSTIKRRKEMKEKGELSANTKPETSNQTATGKMLESLKTRTTKEGVEIYVSAKNRQDVVGKQEEMGRPWMYLSREEEELLNSIIDNEIDNLLKNL